MAYRSSSFRCYSRPNLAAVLVDLLTLAGEPLPAEIAAPLEEPAALTAA